MVSILSNKTEECMRAVRRSEVPEFLRSTKLYRSFCDDEDDELILIPRDCFKLDAVITSTEELHNMCKTIRFWLFDNIPPGMIYYIVEKFNREVEATLREFDNEFRIVDMLVELKRKDEDSALAVAAKYGRMDFVRYFESVGCAVTTKAIESAGGGGHLECLKYLHQRMTNTAELQPFLKVGCSKMISNGHTECLKYSIEHGAVVTYEMLERAAKHNNLTHYEYLLHKCKLRDSRVCSDAAKQGSLSCLNHAVENKCTLAPGTMRAAIWGKSISCTNYLLHCNVNYTMSQKFAITLDAVTFNSADCLRLLLQAGWPVDPTTVTHAAQGGYTECIKVLIDMKIPCLTSRVMEVAAIHGHLRLVEYLHKQGCKWDAETVISCARANKPRCLQYLLVHGGHNVGVFSGLYLSAECKEAVFDVRVEKMRRDFLREY